MRGLSCPAVLPRWLPRHQHPDRGGPLGRDEASCLFFGERYYERIKAAFPDFHDLSPMPENLNTAYLNRIMGRHGAEQRSR